MKKLGKKRKHPSKDTTVQNKSSSTSIKKHNQKKIQSPLEESNPPNNNQVNTQDKLNELSKNKQGLEKLKKYVDSNLSYDSIKFRDIIFKIGDVLLIQASEENLIGELIKIIPINGIKEYPFWPTVQVKWYYKKKDINRKKNNLLNQQNFYSISDYELFPSNHKDIIYIESIINKCKVYTYEEYDNISDPSDFTFFTRAKYEIHTELLNPKFDDWKKGCICKKPLNPDQLYIKCDKCNGWFHPKCCGVDEKDSNKINNFICPNCNKD